MNRLARLAKAWFLPVAVWLAGLVAFAVLGIDGLFAGPNPVFVIARVTAYATAVMVVAVTAAFVAMFGLAAAAMLVWLGGSPTPGLIVTTMSRSFWWVAVYVWLGVVLLIVDPPVALTVFELSDRNALENRVRNTTAFAWMGRLRYLALIGFLVTSLWLLARHARPVNALLAVAFGVAAMAALLTALGLLAGPSGAPGVL